MKFYIFFFILSVLSVFSSLAKSQNHIGSVIAIEGNVELTRNIEVIRIKETGFKVFVNDQIRTREDGKIKIYFIDKSLLSMTEDSSLIIDKYWYDSRNVVRDSILNLIRGTIRLIIHKVYSKNQNFKVKTPSSFCGVRGTDFFVKVEYDGACEWSVKQGKIAVLGLNETKGLAKEIIAFEQIYVSSDGMSSDVTKISNSYMRSLLEETMIIEDLSNKDLLKKATGINKPEKIFLNELNIKEQDNESNPKFSKLFKNEQNDNDDKLNTSDKADSNIDSASDGTVSDSSNTETIQSDTSTSDENTLTSSDSNETEIPIFDINDDSVESSLDDPIEEDVLSTVETEPPVDELSPPVDIEPYNKTKATFIILLPDDYKN